MTTSSLALSMASSRYTNVPLRGKMRSNPKNTSPFRCVQRYCELLRWLCSCFQRCFIAKSPTRSIWQTMRTFLPSPTLLAATVGVKKTRRSTLLQFLTLSVAQFTRVRTLSLSPVTMFAHFFSHTRRPRARVRARWTTSSERWRVAGGGRRCRSGAAATGADALGSRLPVARPTPPPYYTHDRRTARAFARSRAKCTQLANARVARTRGEHCSATLVTNKKKPPFT